MPDKLNNTTGVVLAGGISSRMGKDKGLMNLNGHALVEYAVDILKTITGELLISTNNPGYSSFGFPLVEDLVMDIGPMGGVYSCLKSSPTEKNIIIACDMPFVKPGLFNYLLDNMEDELVVLPSKDGIYPEPMCGIYKKEILPTMEEFIHKGNYKLPDLFRKIPFKMITITGEMEFYSEEMFMNINSMEDLQGANNYMIARENEKITGKGSSR